MTLSTHHRIRTLGVVAVAAVGVAAGSAQAADRSAVPAFTPPAASMDVRAVSLGGRILKVELSCSGGAFDVLVRTPARHTRLQGMCADGSGRAKLVLRRREARAARTRAGLAVTVSATTDKQLLTSVRFSPPGRERAPRSLQANGTWSTADAVCYSHPVLQGMNVQTNGATFGYAFGAKIFWRGMALDYNYATRAYTWVVGGWQSYLAGLASTTGAQSFKVPSNHAVRGAIQILNGDWNYVRVSVALGNYTDGAWCRF